MDKIIEILGAILSVYVISYVAGTQEPNWWTVPTVIILIIVLMVVLTHLIADIL